MTGRILLCTSALLLAAVIHGEAVGDAGKKLTDAEISKRLVGRWKDERKVNDLELKGLDEFKKDGTFKSQGTFTKGDRSLKVTVTGTWKIKDGVLVEVIETCDPPALKKGQESKDQVLSISDKEVKLKNEGGEEYVKVRLAE